MHNNCNNKSALLSTTYIVIITIITIRRMMNDDKKMDGSILRKTNYVFQCSDISALIFF